MVSQLFECHKPRRQKFAFQIGFLLTISIPLSSCLESQPPQPTQVNETRFLAAPSVSSSSNFAASDFTRAGGVKVIFNRSSFYNNQATNTFGCAGDAKYYYDLFSDRIVPSKPSWLKNVSVDITNSNAFYGPSRAIGCSLSGNGSPPAANCATFDDLQPLNGLQSRSVMVGGMGCSKATTGATPCSPTSVLDDIWHLNVIDVATGSTWTSQSAPLPIPASTTLQGLVWHAGDYDEIHDQFFIYGGAAFDTSASVMTFSNKVVALNFNSDGTLATSPSPAVQFNFPTNPTAASMITYYGNWAKSGAFGTGITGANGLPASNLGLVGASFTYGLRRDTTSRSWCLKGDANINGSGQGCPTNTLTAGSAVGANEDHDYFLLVGGLKTDSDTKNKLLKDIYMYKPHGYSTDVGTNAPSTGDWTLLSNNTSAARGTIMRVVDISVNNTSPLAPYSSTLEGNFAPDGSLFNGFLRRAFHRTVYDPLLNRFYIYGGLTTDVLSDAATIDVSAVNPTPSSELWIYDPPALGRRPTAACFATTSPDTTSLPNTSSTMGATINLGPNRNYLGSSFVFPPGGCLQRMRLSSATPPVRFEHAMAFNRDQSSMVIFGGCNSAGAIAKSGALTGGDPTTNCNSASTLLNDTWIYIPPTTTEIVPKSFSASNTSPYNPSTPIPNVFGTDFWLDHMPIYIGNNPQNGILTVPTADQAMGMWIQLTPNLIPTKRVSASMVYDRAHHKFYLFGGSGCTDSTCSTGTKTLDDLWEFTPPDIEKSCNRTTGFCSDQGSWAIIKKSDETLTTQPTIRKGALLAYGQPMFSHGDGFYTVNDTACVSQGPLASFDSSVNKNYVGAIYVDIDRSSFNSNENLLINLRMLPFDKKTKLAGYNNNGNLSNTSAFTDAGTSNDTAIIRVQLLGGGFSFADQIMALIQPRFHNFMPGSPVGDTFMYVSGPSGQVTERQILVPLEFDSRINLVKIERVQGSVKFYEMSVSKF